MNSSEIVSYQTSRLAELDTQLALWGQRLSRLDQQIINTGQAISTSSDRLKEALNTLIAAADAWLAQQDINPTSSDLALKMKDFKARIVLLGGLNFSDPLNTATLKELADELQKFSSELVEDLTKQATAFSEALDKAAIDLATNYGVQI